MHVVSFTLATAHRHGPAFYDFLRLRKAYFVDTLNWDLSHDGEAEMDQYDNPTAHYVVVLEEGEVVAGARGMPTDARWGPHTYMLRDALSGRLAGIPPEIVPGEVASPLIWECTRFVVSDRLVTQARRARAVSLMLDRLSEVTSAHGGERLMSLSPVPMVRTLRQLGYDAERLGEPYTCAEDGRRYAVIAMPTAGRQARPAPTFIRQAPQAAPVLEPLEAAA